MGQLCCFPFSRDEEKISEERGGEPDEAELLRLSRRLVESAVLTAVQQYLEEAQRRGPAGPDPAGADSCAGGGSGR